MMYNINIRNPRPPMKKINTLNIRLMVSAFDTNARKNQVI